MKIAQDRQVYPMPTAQDRLPLESPLGVPAPAAPSGAALARLGRQLLLVPEAVLLAAFLGLHSLLGPSPLLALVGLGVACYFCARMALLTLGRRSLAMAAYDDAEAMVRAALTLYPASADAHALYGAIALARGEAAAARAALARAVVLFPLQADLHATLSAALLQEGHPEEARSAARTALTLDPRSPLAHLHLAGAEEQLGDSPEEVEALLRAGLALPMRPAEEAALRCALVARLLARQNMAAAQAVLAGAETLLANCPAAQRAGLHYYLGELLRLAGNPEGAREQYTASETVDPKGPYAAAAWRAARS